MKNTSQDSLRPKTFNASTLPRSNEKTTMVQRLALRYVYITIEKYTIFQLKSIPVLIVCEDKKSYLNAG